MPKGTVMTVGFELAGQKFTALNGCPHLKFTEAISMVVNCDTQKELEGIEEKVAASLAKRRNVSPRDQDFLFNQRLEEELRKHGA